MSTQLERLWKGLWRYRIVQLTDGVGRVVYELQYTLRVLPLLWVRLDYEVSCPEGMDRLRRVQQLYQGVTQVQVLEESP